MVENEIQVAINNVNKGLEVLEGLILSQHSIIFVGLLIFLTSAIIGLFLHMKNSKETMNNILDILKYLAAIAVILCGTTLNPKDVITSYKLIFFIYIVLNILVIFIYKFLSKKLKK